MRTTGFRTAPSRNTWTAPPTRVYNAPPEAPRPAPTGRPPTPALQADQGLTPPLSLAAAVALACAGCMHVDTALHYQGRPLHRAHLHRHDGVLPPALRPARPSPPWPWPAARSSRRPPATAQPGCHVSFPSSPSGRPGAPLGSRGPPGDGLLQISPRLDFRTFSLHGGSATALTQLAAIGNPALRLPGPQAPDSRRPHRALRLPRHAARHPR